MDVFGAEHFLQVQGHAFYGNIFSHSENPATLGFIKSEKL